MPAGRAASNDSGSVHLTTPLSDCLNRTSLCIAGLRCGMTERAFGDAEDEARERGEGGGHVLPQLLQQRSVDHAEAEPQVAALHAVLQAAQRIQAPSAQPARKHRGVCTFAAAQLWRGICTQCDSLIRHVS